MEQPAASPAVEVEQTSLNFIGQWRGLVSTTNWEKGRIIYQWREALRTSGADTQEYSDEAWSRRVGGVTGQHVGRLRRVFERFGNVRGSYANIYWSHFQAALDWPDAEMWLEGAVQNIWSVNEMRAARWETLGAAADSSTSDAESADVDVDEDFVPAGDEHLAPVRDLGDAGQMGASGQERSVEDGAGRDEAEGLAATGVPFDADAAEYPVAAPDEPVRPFAELPELPQDLAEAFESFKLAILHHKREGWRQIARQDVVASLVALKQLAMAPG